MAKMGRPTKYSNELADRICELISTSNKGLHSICKENEGFPKFSTIFKWLGEADKQYFIDNYARAREAQADFLKDEMFEIADDVSRDTIITVKGEIVTELPNTEWISRSKLRVDTRKWVASKLAPKKYGDKQSIDLDLSDETIEITRKIVGGKV